MGTALGDFPCAAGAAPECLYSSCCAAIQLRDVPVPRSPHSPALISAVAGKRAVRRCCSRTLLSAGAAPARSPAGPPVGRPWARSAPARRAAAAPRRAGPAPPAPPPPAPPLSAAPPAPPRPRRTAGGTHPGKCRRSTPAAPPSSLSCRMDGLQVPAGSAPHARAGRRRRCLLPQPLDLSLQGCLRGLAGVLAGSGFRDPGSGAEGDPGTEAWCSSSCVVELQGARRPSGPPPHLP